MYYRGIDFRCSFFESLFNLHCLQRRIPTISIVCSSKVANSLGNRLRIVADHLCASAAQITSGGEITLPYGSQQLTPFSAFQGFMFEHEYATYDLSMLDQPISLMNCEELILRMCPIGPWLIKKEVSVVCPAKAFGSLAKTVNLAADFLDENPPAHHSALVKRKAR